MVGRLTLLCFLVVGLHASGQSISHSVISIVDDFQEFNNDGFVRLAYSVGEPVVQTLEAFENDITQGFLQPPLQISLTDGKSNSFEIYPNPIYNADRFKDLKIKFEVKDQTSYYVQVYNLWGVPLYNEYFERVYNLQTVVIPFNMYPAGVYLVHVYSANQMLIKTEKILKLDPQKFNDN